MSYSIDVVCTRLCGVWRDLNYLIYFPWWYISRQCIYYHVYSMNQVGRYGRTCLFFGRAINQFAAICVLLFRIPLQWRHNGHDSVPNHQPHDCLFNRLFRRMSNKIQKLHGTGPCVGTVNFPHKWPVTRKMFPFDEVIMHYYNIVMHIHRKPHPQLHISILNLLVIYCDIFILYPILPIITPYKWFRSEITFYFLSFIWHMDKC